VDEEVTQKFGRRMKEKKMLINKNRERKNLSITGKLG